MAIAEMSRIRLYGLESEREAVLNELMRFGAVQLQDAFAEETEKASLEAESSSPTHNLVRPDSRAEVHGLEMRISEAKAALASLDRYAPQKRGMFSVRRQLTAAQMDELFAQNEAVRADLQAILALESQLDTLRTEEGRIQSRLDFLKIWQGVGIDLSMEETRNTRIQAGTLPANGADETVIEKLSQEVPEAVLTCHATTREADHCVAIWHCDVEEEALRVLKDHGWSRVPFRDYEGTPDEIMARLSSRIDGIVLEKESIMAAIRDLADARKGIEDWHDILLMDRDRTGAADQLVVTRKSFLLCGWVPADSCAKLEERLDKRFSCHMETQAPTDADDVPVLVRSNKITEAIRPVMDMYGAPSPREIDPNFLTLPFFAIFFGLIMNDIGYGLILAGAAAFVLLKFKLEDTVRQFAKLVLFCGFSTIGWGIIFGSFFGIASFQKYALWFVPTDEGGTNRLMLWCLVFGVIHLYTGMGLKAANLLRRGKVLDAIFDVGFPYVMFTGFGMTVLPYVPGLDPAMTEVVSSYGLWVLGIGVALVVVTAGRKSKSIIGKTLGGLPRLYDIIGFLGDVLSYMRLLALNLAAGILAGLVNGMASDLNGWVAKIIGGTLLLLLGHGINFAMGILGAFVHSCRLQYLEFFSKFLEGGGSPFRRFGPQTNYIVMKQED